MSCKALFLDRDGVFTELIWFEGASYSYRAPWNWNEVKFYSGLEVLQSIRERGYQLFLVTNQPDIERGLVGTKFVDELNGYLVKKFKLDAAYYCSHVDSFHPDKKPNPGMLLRAAEEFGIELSASWLLGDTKADAGAAKNAGCRSIIVNRPYNNGVEADRRIVHYSELATVLLG